MEPKGEFTESLWTAIKPLYEKMIHHPFVIQLKNGTLPHHCFEHYLAQDILYIQDDSKALEMISEKAPSHDEQTFFKSLAEDGLEIERVLHDDFLIHFKISGTKGKSPVIEDYTRFLIIHASQSSYQIAAAALLPCFWVYYKVGNHIVSHYSKNNIYQKWIDTYQGEEYEMYTGKFIEIVEKLAAVLSEKEQSQMRQAFITSTRFELHFFNESMQEK